MKIKKVLKISVAITAATSASIGAVMAANKAIFKLAKRKDNDPAEGQYFAWEHGKIHYMEKGSGQPLLLIHGLYLGSSHREFYKNLDALSKKYKVYAIDLPGYGYSDKPKITYTAFIYTSFINKFINEVIQKPCYVLGANGGGMLAVITSNLFPENISKLMLISPSGVQDTLAENDDKYARTLHELPLIGETIYTWQVSKSNIKKFLQEEGYFAPEQIDDELVNNFYFSAHATSTDARYANASYNTRYIFMDIKEYYKNLTQPIVVAWGEENTLNSIKSADILKELKPDAKYYLFEKTRSLPHIENAEEFNRIVKENL